MKETSGYIQNVPSGHLAGHIVKVITMYPLITLRSKWWAHCESNLSEWLRSHAGHIVSHILKETHGFFHKVPTGHLAEYIVKELSMHLLVTCWLNCLRNHDVITMETLGKWGFAPSVLCNQPLRHPDLCHPHHPLLPRASLVTAAIEAAMLSGLRSGGPSFKVNFTTFIMTLMACLLVYHSYPLCQCLVICVCHFPGPFACIPCLKPQGPRRTKTKWMSTLKFPHSCTCYHHVSTTI